jgi:serine/threonine protein kinase
MYIEKMENPRQIGEGTYGCVFYPGISCNGQPEKTKYVTKIQIQDETSKNEETIGEYIKKTKKNYSDYFAPIISSCPLKLASIKKDMIENCEVMRKNTDKEFVSVKIKYAGKQTLKEYFNRLLSTYNSSFLYKVVETQMYLLNSLKVLGELKIIHFDLKQNNILFHETKQNPVIIDFGISIMLDKLKDLEYHKYFFSDYEKYPPWCTEIMLISYLVRKPTWGKTNITKKDVKNMQTLVKRYYETNPTIRLVQNQNQNQNPTKTIQSYWEKTITETANKKTKTVVESLLKHWSTWDTYSLMVIYYRYMKSEEAKSIQSAPFIDRYWKLLEEYILSEPKDRKSPLEMITQLKEYMNNIQRKEFLEWNQKQTDSMRRRRRQ